jgi:hypothetical protein
LARDQKSDRSDGFDRIIRHQLAAERDSGGAHCPDASIIASYCDRSLALEERSLWERHFAQCARCAGTIAAFARIGDAVEVPGSARAENIARDARKWWNQRRALPIAAFGATVAVLAVIAIKTFTGEHSSIDLHAKAESGSDQIASNTVAADATARAAKTSLGDRSVIAKNEPVSAKPAPTPSLQSLAKKALSRPLSSSLPRKETPSSARDELLHEKTQARELKQRTEMTDAPAAGAPALGIGRPTASTPSAPPAQPPVVAAAPSAGLGGAIGSAPSIAPPQAPALPLPPSTIAAGAGGVATVPATRIRESASAAATILGSGASAAGAGSGAPVGAGTGSVVDASRGATAIAVEPPDHSVVWMVGARGTISHYSHTAGWAPQASGVTVDLMAGSAPSASICWIVGRAGTILRTLDGVRWSKIDAPVSDDLSSVIAGNATDATITAADGRRFSTSNGGVTWRRL